MAIHGSVSLELDMNEPVELGSVILKGKNFELRRTIFARSLLLDAKTSILSEKLFNIKNKKSQGL